MSNYPEDNEDLLDQLEDISQRTSLAALDALFGAIPGPGEQGGRVVSTAAAESKAIAEHVLRATSEVSQMIEMDRQKTAAREAATEAPAEL